MNIKQLLILAVVLVVLVFVVTFASQYLGSGVQETPAPLPGPVGTHLSFPEGKVYPPLKENDEPEFVLVQEQNPGFRDFWFENISGQPLQLGLSRAGCTCSKVEVCVLPEEEWKKRPAAARSTQAEPDETLTWSTLLEYPKDRKGVPVPVGAGGWLRLRWDGRKSGPQQLTANIWTETRDSEYANAPLSVAVTFLDPVIVQDEESARDPARWQLKLDEKRLGRLEPGVERQAIFLCWSATRDQFIVKPRDTGHACVRTGEPIPLSAAERKQLAELFKLPVKSAYRVPVSVRESMNDTQLDLGNFRYRVSLDTDAGARSVFVSGEVEGAVTVVTPDGRSQVDIGKFPAREDMEVVVNLTTNDSHLKLKLDPGPNKRGPFFQVKEPEEIKEAVGKRWKVEVKIPAGSAEGRFPNPNKPGFEPDDCSIYLAIYRSDEAGNKPWRRIRVPIVGEATAR
jgi:hypothetical protein